MILGVSVREGAALESLCPRNVGAVVGEREVDGALAVPIGAEFERVLGTRAG